MDEIRVFGYCENCGDPITDENEGDYFVSEDGKVFCSYECVCEHHGIAKVEV